MKTLTIWQPWASLIIAGAKPYEFRGWRAPRWLIGQRIVIHAAARKMDGEEVSALWHILMNRKACDELSLAAAETCLIPAKAISVLDQALARQLPFSAGIGTAIIREPRLGTEIAEEFGVPRANDSDRDEHANWAWPMLDIEAWDTPIPMRGAQGFWNWPEPDQLIGGAASRASFPALTSPAGPAPTLTDLAGVKVARSPSSGSASSSKSTSPA